MEEFKVSILEADQLPREVHTGSEVKIMLDAFVNANIRYSRTAVAFDVPAYFVNVRRRKFCWISSRQACYKVD